MKILNNLIKFITGKDLQEAQETIDKERKEYRSSLDERQRGLYDTLMTTHISPARYLLSLEKRIYNLEQRLNNGESETRT